MIIPLVYLKVLCSESNYLSFINDDIIDTSYFPRERVNVIEDREILLCVKI